MPLRGEKEGKLCALWADVKMNTKLYIAHHHAIAKRQRNSHNIFLETFQDGDVVIETDFIEKYTPPAQKVRYVLKSRPNNPHGGRRAILPEAVGEGRQRTSDGEVDLCFGGP